MKETTDENLKIPQLLVWGTVAICVLPFLLNQLGIDFGSSKVIFSNSTLVEMAPNQIVDAMHLSLKGSFIHSLLEWTAFCTALFIVLFSFMHFYTERDITTPIIGMALFCAGAMDAFHTLAADRLISAVADNRDLIPFTWAICRVFNALILIIGVGLIMIRGPKKLKKGFTFVLITSVVFGFIAYGIIDYCATTENLPKTMYPDALVTRPWDVVPLVLFLFAGIVVFPVFYKKYPSVFSHSLIIAVLPNIATQMHMAFGSSVLFDNHFNIGHFLKIVSYLIPLLGLCLNYIRLNANQKEAAKKLAHAKGEADRASKTKTNFLANMSHEIRTPMNSVIGMSELLAETELTSEQKQLIKVLRNAGENLMILINDILDLSKIEAGQIELESIPFDLWQFLGKTVEILDLRAEEKGLRLEYSIAQDVPHHLAGDSHRLRQILTNLISNAVKFTDKGEIRIHIEREPDSTEPACLLISVADNGIGIPQDKLQEIFNSFSQADATTTRKYGGTGLGLTITKSLTELMGGRMWVESQEGEGSTFFFTVCFKVDDAPPETTLVIPPQLTQAKVMVVDHRPTFRSMFKNQLLDWHVSVKEMAAGWEALQELKHAKDQGEPYTLLVIPSRLPGKGGFAMVEKIRNELHQNIPTLMVLPIDTRIGDIDKCMQSGLVPYVTKYIEPEEFLEKISTALIQGSRVVTAPKPAQVEPVHKEDLHRILLVEDSEDNRLLVQLYLKKSPYQVDIAENGKEAYQKYMEEDYDLILMDMQMPVMDGYTAARKIREVEDLKNCEAIPIIALTAHALKGDREKCLEAGCSDYLSKPLKKEKLLELIRQYLIIPVAEKSL